MRLLLVATLTLVHEVTWLLYIRGVSQRRLVQAIVANGAILASGGGLMYCVAHRPSDIAVMVAAGMLGTALFWRLRR